MTSIVLLVGQLGIVLGGFIGMGKLLEFYNGESKSKGGDKRDNLNNKKPTI